MTPSSLPVQPPRDPFLDELPSETTPGERDLLLKFFRDDWSGTGTVVELGPFLGGTTRAIALGMAANPRLAADAALHTFDRFDEYHSATELRKAVEPLVQRGVFTAAVADDLCRDANFERLFHALHSPHAYAQRVHLHNSPLPDRPEEVSTSKSLDVLADGREISAVFVDGCKSWASTHYAMKFLLPRLREGAPVIFQDYGWYTCFWITSFVHALREYLEPAGRVDATYVFRLKKTITAEGIERRFALTPHEMGETFFRKAAAALLERSRRELDLRAELIAQLHQVAALVTIGRRGAAADVLKRMDVKRYAIFAYMIRGCLQSPTYLPGGKQVLWKEAA
jgi:hypothetical protein